jgi:hypothetical protein
VRSSDSNVEGWFCSDCKSLNGQRMTRCYSCNTPRKFAEAGVLRRDGDIVTTARVAPAAPGPDGSPGPAVAPGQPARPYRPALPDLLNYRSSASAALPVTLLLAVCVGHTALTMMLVTTKGGVFGLASELAGSLMGGSEYPLPWILPLAGSRFVLLAITAALWFAWFDRVLQNVPVLTGSWPENSRSSAVGWWLVPGANLVRGPRVVGDVYDRLSVPGGPGLWLLGLWAASFIGAFVVPAIANRVLAWAIIPLPEDLTDQAIALVGVAGQLLEIAAGLLAIGVVVTLEHAQQVRYAQAMSERDGTPLRAPTHAPSPQPHSHHGMSWATELLGGNPDEPVGTDATPVPRRKLVPLVAAVVLVVAMIMTGIALGRVLHPSPGQPGTVQGPAPGGPVPTAQPVKPGSTSAPVPPMRPSDHRRAN